MSNFAETRTKTDSLMSATSALPAVLALNSAALFALDRLGGIPQWIKSAASLFLAF